MASFRLALLLLAALWPRGAAAVGPHCAQADELVCKVGASTIAGPWTFSGASPLLFDGATPDANKTTFTFTDPTAARTVTFPNANSNTVKPADCGTVQNVRSIGSDGTITCQSVSDLACSGPCVSASEIDVLSGAIPLVFEGLTADAFETSLAVTDPTADRTFTLPNADSVAVQPATCSSQQPVTAVSALGVLTCTDIYSATHTWSAKQTLTSAPQINAASPASGKVWTATDATGNASWQSFSGAGGGGWTDGGVNVALTTISDKVGIGTAAPGAKFEVVGDQPASVGAGSGTDADIGGNFTGGKGGNTTDATGDVGGTGGGMFFQGGAGGDAPAGSTNGSGGHVSFTGGLPGGGLGSAGNQGSIFMTGRLVVLDGATSVQPQTQNLTADNTTLVVIRGALTLTSDNATATNRTMIMPTPVQDGQHVILAWTGTNGGELVDNSAQTGGGTTRLASTWTPTQYDTLVLFAPTAGGDWYELSRSAN